MRFVGCDRNGIPRVYGDASNEYEAFQECRHAVDEYVRLRPDTGPVSSWLIEPGCYAHIVNGKRAG